jgi:hypothetical protein
MPFCPSCRQEFESFVTRCYDCEVDLVAALKSGREAAPDAAAVVILDAPSAEYVLKLLQSAGVPARAEPGTASGLRQGASFVVFPVPYAQGVVGALSADPALEEVEPQNAARAPHPIVGAFRAAPRKVADDSIQTAPLLDEPVPLLVRRGESILPELVELVRRGAPKLRETALSAVSGFGPKGRASLIAELPRWARELRADALYGAAKVLRDAKVDETAWLGLLDLASERAGKSDARCLALHVLGRTGQVRFASRILPLLQDPDLHVREAADEALCNLLDDDLGFDPEAGESDRKRVVEAWGKLLAKRGLV